MKMIIVEIGKLLALDVNIGGEIAPLKKLLFGKYFVISHKELFILPDSIDMEQLAPGYIYPETIKTRFEHNRKKVAHHFTAEDTDTHVYRQTPGDQLYVFDDLPLKEIETCAQLSESLIKACNTALMSPNLTQPSNIVPLYPNVSQTTVNKPQTPNKSPLLFQTHEYQQQLIDFFDSLKVISSDNKSTQHLITEAKRYGFDCQDTKHDGNCLFHAVADQVKATLYPDAIELYKWLRQMAVNEILTHFNHYKNFINTEVNTPNEFVTKAMSDSTWAGQIMITALANALSLNVVIIRSDASTPTIIKRQQPIMTIYLGYEPGLHYQSLHKNPSIKPEKDIDAVIANTANDSQVQQLSNHTH